MPGNEVEVARYLFSNLGKLKLPYFGMIESIGSPRSNSAGYYPISRPDQLRLISSPDASKKADIYLNGIGVSVKQSGSCFAFNRIQRANIQALFMQLGFSDINAKLSRIDKEVQRFHEGSLSTRNRPWEDFFAENDFKKLLEYLMMRGSPNLGPSNHPAQFILEAEEYSGSWRIDVYSFEDYFTKYKSNFRIAIRRQWIGQDSNSEHNRAVGLAKKSGNKPWVFDNAVGIPNSGWRAGFPEKCRKTVYFLMIEKLP